MGRIPCCEKDNVKRGQWTPEEDNKLSSYIAQHGTRNWRLIPKNAGSQTAVSFSNFYDYCFIEKKNRVVITVMVHFQASRDVGKVVGCGGLIIFAPT